ncbi:predicted protein [Uncinocarpus reesii 1704]|uniref:Uncharacterized protein n=1 Tax=Uncinocarpus reesii (strain UAMH 1704) TaxID=336963 RepID=C4JK85_UNCRE|nr:uncharacterized protein UREG_02042 [Uncinocarpus reesii 1704]EEP77193.1 predicted protein [Uncinocarpus reesii 1704]
MSEQAWLLCGVCCCLCSVRVEFRDKLQKLLDDGGVDTETAQVLFRHYDIVECVDMLYLRIRNPEKARYTPEEAKAVNVQVTSWNEQKPIFFQQMSERDFESYDLISPFEVRSLFNRDSEIEYVSYVHSMLGSSILGSKHRQDQDDLLDHTGWHSERNTWRRKSILDTAHPRRGESAYGWLAAEMLGRKDVPHTIAYSLHECHDSDHILRSELMILLRIIQTKRRRPEWYPHDLTPVLLVSIRAFAFRIMEGYFDGSKLVINMSDAIPVKVGEEQTSQQKKVNGVLRWIGSKPVGDTLRFKAPFKDY